LVLKKSRRIKMKLAIGADHRGFKLKESLKEYLSSKGYEVFDKGAFNDEASDYPDYANEVGKSVASGESDYGILMCGSGMGICIAANKVNGIRAILPCSEKMAEMGRRHNNANVLCFDADIIKPETAQKYIKIFLKAEFEGGEGSRHERRVKKMSEIEYENK
jgi:ribose 5-phosphate isomerase B